MPTDRCLICDLADQQSDNAGDQRVRVNCERCGTFIYQVRDAVASPSMANEGKVNLSAFVREQNAVGIVPLLTAELMDQVKRRRRPRLRDRASRALAAKVQDVGYDLSRKLVISEKPRIQAVSYSADENELSILLEILEGDGLIKTAGMIPTSIIIAPAGLIQAEELSQPGTAYIQGFVAMSFDPSMNDAYTRGFYPGISAAGYRPFRIDAKEHINGISDEILAEIRRSRFLVADYTHMNNGVYFEAGVAVGLGIPLIPTCRADHLDKLHFDIKHINTLKWESPEQLARDLAKRIAGVIGEGPLPISET